MLNDDGFIGTSSSFHLKNDLKDQQKRWVIGRVRRIMVHESMNKHMKNLR